MPYIISARPDDLDRGPGAATARLGDRLQEFGKTLGERRDRQQLAEQRLAAEEERAKAATLREERILAEKEAGANERQADREAVVTGLKEVAAKRAGRVWQEGLRKAVASPGGALGPFGALNTKAAMAGMNAAAETQRRMQAKIEQARHMSPAAARAFLEREGELEKQDALVSAYGRTARQLEVALREGKLDEATAKGLGGALRTSLAEKKPPEGVQQLIAKAVDMHVKLTTRLKGWEKADERAEVMIDAIRTAMTNSVDHEVRESLSKLLIDAGHEWERTKPADGFEPEFRKETDPSESLAALEKMMFRAHVEQDPEGFAAVEEALGEAEIRRREARGPSQASQDAPGDEQAGGAEAPAPAAKRRAPAQRKRVEGLVMKGAQEALQMGPKVEVASRLQQLEKQIAQDLGVDPGSPEVEALVDEALAQAFEALAPERNPATGTAASPQRGQR